MKRSMWETPIPAESRMNFLLLILLDISASDDESPCLSVARWPLEALIANWERQGEEINLLRDRVASRNPPSLHRSQSVLSDGCH